MQVAGGSNSELMLHQWWSAVVGVSNGCQMKLAVVLVSSDRHDSVSGLRLQM